MNSTTRDWTTSTMSIGVPVRDCIAKPPARRAPNSRPAKKVPSGLDRPSSATVIASNPKLAAMPAVRTFSVPRTCAVPAMPARPPATSITSRYIRLTLMPAVRAALGLDPTARNANPIVDRFISHQTNTAARMATTKPRCRRNCGPSSCGYSAVSAIGGDTGLLLSPRLNADVVSR